MQPESTRLIAGYFHLCRSARKRQRPPTPSDIRFQEQLREMRALREAADIHAWERSFDQ